MEDFIKYYLHPSKIIIPEEGSWITTVLGSCVSVCIYDTHNKTGGMNHFMLPFWNGEGLESPRYGNVAISRLIEEMLIAGSRKSNLIAKVFGGGKVLGKTISMFHVGERNISVAHRLLEEYKIPIVASSTGGDKGRKIFFNTKTGEVLQQYLK